MKKIYNAILNLIFPKKCIHCGKRGTYFCEDCLSLIEVNKSIYCTCKKPRKGMAKCPLCNNALDRLFAISFNNQKLLNKLIYKSQKIKELSYPLTFLIIAHLKNIKNDITKDFIIFPSTKKSRNQLFNNAEEIINLLSKTLKIKISEDVKNKNVLIIDISDKNMRKMAQQLKQKETNRIYGICLIRGL